MKTTAMRKFHLISTVFSLFLLVPASITRAQVTKTLNGTVRYESGMSKTTFNTPNGDISVNLPQSLSGAVISGTVSTEPAGKTEKEKSRNLKELQKYVIMLDGQKIPLSATAANFDWLTHVDRQMRTPVELLNVSGTKIAELSLPPVLSSPAIVYAGNPPRLTTPSNVLVKGDALNIYTDQQFSPGQKFVLTDSKGQKFTMNPVCLSSQQAVMSVPEGASPGYCSVIGVYMGIDYITHVRFNLIDINLTSPNTNLLKGENSSVTLTIKTKENLSGLDSNEFLVFRVDMKNLTPGVVDMAGGNMQAVSFPLSENRQDPSAWQLTRTITGVKPGGFSVSATLHEDYNTSNDPFRPQLNVLRTPEDFNAWANALKKDLKIFRTSAFAEAIDEIPVLLKANTQRAVDNMPVCTSPEQLDECKAVAYSLIRPLNVPQGAANTWISSYEAFKTSLKSPEPGLAEKTNLTDWDIVNNGIDFIEQISYRSNDPSMTQDITNARELINTIIETGETKENLGQLNQSLQSLSSRTDKKLMTATTVNKVWKLKDVLFSTYCMNKRSKDGIDPVKSMIGYLDPEKKILHVKPEYQQQVLNSLKAVSLGKGSYKISTVTATLKPVTYSVLLAPLILANINDGGDIWAERLIEGARSDTSLGSILSTHRDSAGTYYIFYKDAKCEQRNDEKGATYTCTPFRAWNEREQKLEQQTYLTTIQNSKARCRKGTDFCTEVYVITAVFNQYQDPNCIRLINVSTRFGFSCL